MDYPAGWDVQETWYALLGVGPKTLLNSKLTEAQISIQTSNRRLHPLSGGRATTEPYWAVIVAEVRGSYNILTPFRYPCPPETGT
ncbi:hypothetical protein PM082_004607 [Marasmius tenuissimus]|nr:hypothetical protein PM082_004607 [Marasmius tenuissimus]